MIATTGVVIETQRPLPNTTNASHTRVAAARNATAAVSQALRNKPAVPTMAAPTIVRTAVIHSGDRTIDRLANRPSSTLACTSGPLISPSGNGVVNVS